jgi:hypothetical protein
MSDTGQPSSVPTIRVMRADGNGSHLINLSDYDPRKHKKAEAYEAVPIVTFQAEVASSVVKEDVFDLMSDAELRKFIREKTGKAPHGLSRRKALLETARTV